VTCVGTDPGEETGGGGGREVVAHADRPRALSEQRDAGRVVAAQVEIETKV